MAVLPFDAVASLGPPGSFTLTRLVALGVIGGWALQVLIRRRPILLATPAYFLLAFVAFGASSLGWAISPSTTRYFLFSIVQLCGLYLMLSNVLRSPRLWGRAADLWLGSSSIVSLIVIFQFRSLEAVARASLSVGGIDANANLIATSLSLPAVIAIARGRASGPLGWWRLAALVPIGMAILLTGSRGGLIGLVCGVLVIGTMRPRLALRAVVAALPILALVAVLAPGKVASVGERFSRARQDRWSGRLDIWKVGMKIVADNSLLGVGLGNYRSVSYPYMLKTEVDPGYARMKAIQGAAHGAGAHNSYLTALGELGAVGAALFCAVLATHAWGVATVLRRYRLLRQRECYGLALAILGALGSLMVYGLSGDLFLSQYMWVTLALAHATILMRPPIDKMASQGECSP